MKKFRFNFQLSFLLIFLFSSCTTTRGLNDSRSGGLDYYGNSSYRNIGDPSDPDSIAYFEQNINNKVYFDMNEYQFNEESKEVADSQASWLINHRNYKIVIEGHCDERGTREYNIALGEKRAFELKKHLIRHGINANIISIISYGKEKPEAYGSNEQSWALNRRASIILE